MYIILVKVTQIECTHEQYHWKNRRTVAEQECLLKRYTTEKEGMDNFIGRTEEIVAEQKSLLKRYTTERSRKSRKDGESVATVTIHVL